MAAAGEMDCEMKNISGQNVNIDTFRKLVRSYLDLVSAISV